MKKRARICLYVFLICSFLALGIGGYFLFRGGSDDVRVGRKFVTFSQVEDASYYKANIEDKNKNTKEAVYKVKETDKENTRKFVVEVTVDEEKIAEESYDLVVLKEYEEKIDCTIKNYTIKFFSMDKIYTYPDETLKNVDKNTFCFVVSDYFDSFFMEDGKYTITLVPYDEENNKILDAAGNDIKLQKNYDYKAEFEQDFLRREKFFYDGVWYDYIIENEEELKSLVWWTLLYREGTEGLSFYIKTPSIHSGNLYRLVVENINDYPEYDGINERDISTEVKGDVGIIKFSYYLSEDFLKNYKDLEDLDRQNNTSYFDEAIKEIRKPIESLKAEYVKKEITEDKTFEIDKKEDEVLVHNSEQLFMVVQSGAKPKFKEDCVAKTIYENARKVLEEINFSNSLNDYEKALNIYRYLVCNIMYDDVIYRYMELKNDRSTKTFGNFSCFYLEGVFYDFEGLENKYAVCDGLAKAYSLMCNIEGIKCIKINGTLQGVGHAWNLVHLKDNSVIEDGFYYVDVTAGESRVIKDDVPRQTIFHSNFGDIKYVRQETYPKDLKKYDIKSFDYYEITKLDIEGTPHSLVAENINDLKTLFDYAQNRKEENGKYVLEIKLQFTIDDLETFLENLNFVNLNLGDIVYSKTLGVLRACFTN